MKPGDLVHVQAFNRNGSGVIVYATSGEYSVERTYMVLFNGKVDWFFEHQLRAR
jgi:hypothetical protein